MTGGAAEAYAMQLGDDLQAEHTWASEVVIRLLRGDTRGAGEGEAPDVHRSVC
jgi:hypothetical protein